MVISSNDPKIRLFGVTNNPHLTADQQGNKISNAKIKAHDWTHLGDIDWKVSAVSEWVSASQVIQSFHLLSELTQNVSTFPSTTQKYHYFFQKNKNKKPELFWFFFHYSLAFIPAFWTWSWIPTLLLVCSLQAFCTRKADTEVEKKKYTTVKPLEAPL